eukprot:COSAG04_NODE_970_length_9101_cov_663.450900_6_plen_134_part_00
MVKRVKEDALAHREWKQAREVELRQLRKKQQRTQYELSKVEAVREKQEVVLKRKHEEVAAAHRRVKEMEKQSVKSRAGKGRLLPAGNMEPGVVGAWLVRLANSFFAQKNGFSVLKRLSFDRRSTSASARRRSR